ncbi:MAG TPA: hypothetical protein VK327_06220, partial [Candidatus Paceibacterota bacterium]|nr:hypothetical protein [Candidatus Paceibacterota bacterium]
ISDPACPPDIKIKAAMAAGDAYMSRNEAGATNRLADLEEAASYFNYVLKNFPTNSQTPLAWGLLGNCYKELGASDAKFYERAADAYARVINFPGVSTGTQRKAMVGLGVLAEAKAENSGGDVQKGLLKEAFRNYLDAFTFADLQEGDPDDLYWMQKAGMECARLAESFGQWSKAVNIYTQLQALPNLSPAFQSALEKRISKAREHLASGKSD